MKSSRSIFSRLIAVAAIGLIAAATVVIDTAMRFGGYARDYFAVAVGMFKRSDPHFPVSAPHATPALGLVQAKAFLMRMAQRPRPEDSSLWRMSPAN